MLHNISGTLIPVQSEAEDFMGGTMDPRTKIDRSWTADRKNGKSRTRPDQDLKGLSLRKPSISEKARTNSDQDQIFSEMTTIRIFLPPWASSKMLQFSFRTLGDAVCHFKSSSGCLSDQCFRYFYSNLGK